MMSWMSSWRTTLIGVIAFCSVFFTQLKYQLDDDPETEANWNLVVAAAGVLGVAGTARDNGTSDEKAGAKSDKPV